MHRKLMEMGYASSNIIFGAGSLSFNAIEEDGILKPYTRDTFSVAIKATYAEINGDPIFVFKNPKTDTDNFKKSQKGCCIVYKGERGEITYKDELNWKDLEISENKNINLLTPIFTNGKMIKEQSLSEIRNTLHGGKF